MSVFVACFKTIRGAAPATLPQKHLTWFKALINSLERDVQYKDHHLKGDIDQIIESNKQRVWSSTIPSN